MKKVLRILFLVCCIIPAFESLSAGTLLDSLFVELDKTIAQDSLYISLKEKKIQDLKSALPQMTNNEERFQLYKKIFNEYEAFICDSAYVYSQLSLHLAEQTGNVFWQNESKLQLANILTISGMYTEAVDILASINKSELTGEQIVSYYTRYYHAYAEWSEFAEYEYAAEYKRLGKVYQDSMLSVLHPNSFEYTIESAWRYITQREYDKAKELLFSFLPKVEKNTRNYSIITSIIGILYWYTNDMEKHNEYLAISAVSDIKASVMETTSLRSLANLLYNKGELERANSYIKKSLKDANFYNARLRSIQISRLYPYIENAYQTEQKHQQKMLRTSLIVISLLSVLLICLIIYIIQQFGKLSESKRQTFVINEKLQANNKALTEANSIKEEYLGRFLNLCSIYIEKMENRQRTLNKKAKEGNMDELFRTLKSNTFIDDEFNEFYQNFDSAFLNIFPDFVNQFNSLLIDEEKITPKQGEKLTTELRIFALIRLGINDSLQISKFLRYSITTIYNYRSKYRNKAIVPREEFENEVMKISSF